ncbi:MAG: hypothetical protein JWN02_2853, partial [Acidobacteria bacterium]|nr:hypothetical protein [Acidobacteriota bacterium]
MTLRGQHLLLLVILSVALPLCAQQAPYDTRIQQLEQKLDTLVRQASELRQELDRLKAGQPQATPATPPEEDLTKIDVVQTAAAPGAQPAAQPSAAAAASSTAQPQSALTDVTTINNASD